MLFGVSVGLALGLPLLARQPAAACPCSACLAVPAALVHAEADGLTCVGASAECDGSCSQCAAGQTRGEPTCSSAGLSLLEEQAALHAHCPPPQPCSCNCECPEIVNPVPVAGPLLPTPTPMQLMQSPALLQTKSFASLDASQQHSVDTKHRGHTAQPLPGTAPAMPGAPINLMPPPPMPPLPPMPPDLRIQDCPHNTPCTCYCHCRRPPVAQQAQMFTPPTLAPCNIVPTTTTTTTTTPAAAAPAAVYAPAAAPVEYGTTGTTPEPPCVPMPLDTRAEDGGLGPWGPGKIWGPKLTEIPEHHPPPPPAHLVAPPPLVPPVV